MTDNDALDATKEKEKARTRIEGLIPDPQVRSAVLNSLADSIIESNRVYDKTWGVNILRNSLIRLARMHQVKQLAWELSDVSGNVWFHIVEEALTQDTIKALQNNHVEIDRERYNWVGIYLKLPEQNDLLPLVLPAHYAFLRQGPNYDLPTPSRRTHIKTGFGIVEYMKEFLKRPDLPQPGYIVVKDGTATVEGASEGEIPVNTFDSIENFLKSKGYYFSRTQIACFYTALQTKGFVILSGISGTGKTKLAQEFTRLLPQPVGASIIPNDIIRIKIQPYMRKYSRMIIPKAGVKLFNPPGPGESVPVILEFDGQKESCQLSHFKNPDTDYVHLLLKGKARTWFLANFPEKSEIGLELQLNTDGNLSGFKLASPDQFAQPDPGQKDGSPENNLFLSVRTDWRDSKSLLGYYNPLTKTYRSTPFVEFLLKAKQSYDKQDGYAWFVILDEMNLARVEYYFADLLSVLESGRDDLGYTREMLRFDSGELEEGAEGVPEAIKLPPNLYIVGTVNVDETTQSFSPKVLDRAFSIEFTDVDFDLYAASTQSQPPDWDPNQLLKQFTREGRFARIDKEEVRAFVEQEKEGYHYDLQQLNKSLQPFNFHFGYRVYDEIMAFLKNATDNGMEINEAFDQAVLMKVLPKFHGPRGKLEKPLQAILRWCYHANEGDNGPVQKALSAPEAALEGDWYYPETAKRVLRMLQSLNSTGFASFG